MATGHATCPELCREQLPARRCRGWLWVQAELVAMATDLAEVIGGAIALNLLFGVPLFAGGLITGVVAFALLGAAAAAATGGSSTSSSACSTVISVGFPSQPGCSSPRPRRARRAVRGSGARASTAPIPLLLAASMLGATVMPHAIYLHSALTQGRMPCRARLGARYAAEVASWTTSSSHWPSRGR